MLFDNSVASYEEVVKFFFTFHDPTFKDRQGNDVGTQYASAIFVHSDAQKQTAEDVKAKVAALHTKGKIPMYRGGAVETYIAQATVFYPAHLDH